MLDRTREQRLGMIKQGRCYIRRKQWIDRMDRLIEIAENKRAIKAEALKTNKFMTKPVKEVLVYDTTSLIENYLIEDKIDLIPIEKQPDAVPNKNSEDVQINSATVNTEPIELSIKPVQSVHAIIEVSKESEAEMLIERD